MTQFVNEVNLKFYENHFSEGISPHIMPDVNTVRCEVWFFRKHRNPARLLDYGFGYGQELIYFAENGYDVYGLDISPSAKSRFDDYMRRNRPALMDKIKTRILDPGASHLPFEDNWFDFIHSNTVIHYLPSEEAVKGLLHEWHRILNPGGLLMFSTVGPQNSVIKNGVQVDENFYVLEHKTPNAAESTNTRSFLMKDEAHIRSLCYMFDIQEIGWSSYQYCGVDGFHWQVLAKK